MVTTHLDCLVVESERDSINIPRCVLAVEIDPPFAVAFPVYRPDERESLAGDVVRTSFCRSWAGEFDEAVDRAGSVMAIPVIMKDVLDVARPNVSL